MLNDPLKLAYVPSQILVTKAFSIKLCNGPLDFVKSAITTPTARAPSKFRMALSASSQELETGPSLTHARHLLPAEEWGVPAFPGRVEYLSAFPRFEFLCVQWLRTQVPFPKIRS